MVECSRHQTPTTSHLFPLSPGREVRGGVWVWKLGVISQERLKMDVKLLMSANRKSYTASLAQQKDDLEWPFHRRALSLR